MPSDVYLLNDRGAIYAIGYPRTSLLGAPGGAGRARRAGRPHLRGAPGRRHARVAARRAGAGVGPGAVPRGARQLLPHAVPGVRRGRGGRAGRGAGAGHARLHGHVARARTSNARRRAPCCRPAASSRTSPRIESRGRHQPAGARRQPARVAQPRHRRGHQRLCRHRPARVERAEPVRLGPAARRARRATIYRALVLDGRPDATSRARRSAPTSTCVASAPVRVDDQQAIVSVPLTLRQRGIERQVDELDRRVLLAAIAFILLGSAIGYWAAERISDPVSRLTRATRRLAAGDLDARVLVTLERRAGPARSRRSTAWPTTCSGSGASSSAPTASRPGPRWRGRWRTTSRIR